MTMNAKNDNNDIDINSNTNITNQNHKSDAMIIIKKDQFCDTLDINDIECVHNNNNNDHDDDYNDDSKDADDIQANWMLFPIVTFACIGASMFGMDQGNFGNIQGFPSFQTDWCLNNYGDNATCYGTEAADNKNWQNNFVIWGAALITFGSAFGALLLGPLIAPNFGRRPTIAIGALITILGCTITAFLNFENKSVFFLGRFITGFGVGNCTYCIPFYVAELSPAKMRGRLGSIFQLNIVIGQCIATMVTLYITDWRWGVMLPALPAVFLLSGVFFIPESPRYLTKKNAKEAAIKSLKRVRKGDVTHEANSIDNAIEKEKNYPKVSYYQMFKNRNVLHRVMVACGVQACQQLTGVNVFLGYASTIFTQIGIDDPLTFNAIFNGVMLFGCVIGLYLMDVDHWTCGRKSQLLMSSGLMAPTLFIGGLALTQNWSGVLTMIMVLLYALGFNLGWGPVNWLYTSEIFEMHYREKAMSLGVFTQYISNAAVVLVTPHLITWNIGASLLIFAGTNVFDLVFTYLFVVETKGRVLEDIPAYFDKSSKTKKHKDILKKENAVSA